jgi:saccharopine dehydrogenase (NADP+, L-glutamate forming)
MYVHPSLMACHVLIGFFLDRERYAIPEANTIIRGTMRYAGNPEFIKVLLDIGFLSDVETDYLKAEGNLTWKEFTAKLIGSKSNAYDDLVWGISSKTQFAGMYFLTQRS